MYIVYQSTDKYGDCQFTLTPEEKSLLLESIKDSVRNISSDEDTILKEDAKIMMWLLTDTKVFTKPGMWYYNTILERVKYWLGKTEYAGNQLEDEFEYPLPAD